MSFCLGGMNKTPPPPKKKKKKKKKKNHLQVYANISYKMYL